MTFEEAIREADREWEARVIPNGKEMNWNGHKLRFELSPSDCVGCFFKDKNECPECDDGAWVEDSPWYTGKPTEEGWYLLYISKPYASYHLAFYQFGHWFSTDEYCIVREDVVAWMPIPPYEENPIEAFMSKQPCDKCLFQNTPNCKIFGIGVNGEMGCTFKERVRMSELEDDSAVVLERT